MNFDHSINDFKERATTYFVRQKVVTQFEKLKIVTCYVQKIGMVLVWCRFLTVSFNANMLNLVALLTILFYTKDGK